MDVATVGVAALSLFRGDKELSELRVALAAVAPIPILVSIPDEYIAHLNQDFGNEKIIQVASVVAERAQPISDIRASAAYRRILFVY